MRQMLYTLNGSRASTLTGRPRFSYMGRTRMGSIEIPPEVVQAMTDAMKDPGTRNTILHFLGIGPSYNAANGGEVARQLGNNVGLPWANAYMQWLKEFAPAIWQNGNVWDPGLSNASTWHDTYLQWIAAGIPEGTLFDGNMHPKGLSEALAQVQAQHAAGGDQRSTPDNTPPPASPGLSTGEKVGIGLAIAKVLKLF